MTLPPIDAPAPGRSPDQRATAAIGAAARNLIVLAPKALLAALLVIAVGDMLLGVFLRYVVVAVTDYFDLPGIDFFWAEEVGELALAWLTLVGAAIAVAERTHFALGIVVHLLPLRVQRTMDRINHLLIAGFGVLVAVQGARLSALNATLMSPALEIDLAWLYGASVVGGALIVVYALASALARFPAEWKPVGRPESAPHLELGAHSDARPVSTFSECAPGSLASPPAGVGGP